MKNVITISRQKGSGGASVARLVADRLGWPLVRRGMITEAARKAGVDDLKIQAAFDHRPSLQDRITMQQRYSKYLDVLSAVVREYAEKGDVVLLGRGAHVILGEREELFRVFLVADLDERVRRVAECKRLKGGKGLDEARRLIIESDYARAAYHTYLFDVDWNDPLIYEIVLNTTNLTIEQAAGIVLSAFETARR